MADGGGDFRLAQQHDAIDQIADHREGVAIIQANAAAKRICQSRQFLAEDRLARLQGQIHSGAAFHADTERADIAALRLQCSGDTRGEAAAGKRNHYGFDIGQVVQQLQPQGTLTGDDVRMIKGRHHGHAFLGNQTIDLDLRVILAFADDAHFRSQRLDAIDLVPGHQRRHADDTARAGLLSGIGKAAPMIAGGGCGDAAPRSLKLPVIWWCSSLRYTGAPATSDRLGEWASGVGRMRPLMRVLAWWKALAGIIAR
jgi:hypothetical protein